jgi:hypothetical protein
MRRNRVIVLIAAIFIAGFICGMVFNGSHLISLMSSVQAEPQILSRPPMQKQYWEYRVVTRTSSHKDLDAELGKLGDQGFEVFSVSQTKSNSTGFVLTILLRRLKY